MGHPQGISQAALNAAGSSSPSRLTRLESMVENLKVDQARDRDSVQLLYAEIVEMKQDKWWAEDVGSPSNPEIRSQQGASPMNRAGTFEMFSDDEQEHHAASSSAGVRDVESESLRTKDLHHFKVPPLPNDAGQFRSWKNSLRALIMSYDRSSTGMLLDWFNKALVARTPDECKELADSSGDFPRFDRVITAALCKPEHLRSHFGVRFQSFLEACESSGSQARGRFMLNMVAKEFDIDRNSGAITTALELYNLPPPQENIASLKQWRDKVRYIMNQISASDQPEPRLLAKWLYDRLRKHREGTLIGLGTPKPTQTSEPSNGYGANLKRQSWNLRWRPMLWPFRSNSAEVLRSSKLKKRPVVCQAKQLARVILIRRIPNERCQSSHLPRKRKCHAFILLKTNASEKSVHSNMTLLPKQRLSPNRKQTPNLKSLPNLG